MLLTISASQFGAVEASADARIIRRIWSALRHAFAPEVAPAFEWTEARVREERVALDEAGLDEPLDVTIHLALRHAQQAVPPTADLWIAEWLARPVPLQSTKLGMLRGFLQDGSTADPSYRVALSAGEAAKGAFVESGRGRPQ